MPCLLISPSDLRDAQRALYLSLREQGRSVSFVTAAADEDGTYLEVGVSDAEVRDVPDSFRGVRVVVTVAPRAVLLVGDRASRELSV